MPSVCTHYFLLICAHLSYEVAESSAINSDRRMQILQALALPLGVVLARLWIGKIDEHTVPTHWAYSGKMSVLNQSAICCMAATNGLVVA